VTGALLCAFPHRNVARLAPNGPILLSVAPSPTLGGHRPRIPSTAETPCGARMSWTPPWTVASAPTWLLPALVLAISTRPLQIVQSGMRGGVPIYVRTALRVLSNSGLSCGFWSPMRVRNSPQSPLGPALPLSMNAAPTHLATRPRPSRGCQPDSVAPVRLRWARRVLCDAARSRPICAVRAIAESLRWRALARMCAGRSNCMRRMFKGNGGSGGQAMAVGWARGRESHPSLPGPI
jgi:hypothetical protein